MISCSFCRVFVFLTREEEEQKKEDHEDGGSRSAPLPPPQCGEYPHSWDNWMERSGKCETSTTILK